VYPSNLPYFFSFLSLPSPVQVMKNQGEVHFPLEQKYGGENRTDKEREKGISGLLNLSERDPLE